MKRLLALGMSTILALPVLSIAVVRAQETTQTTNTTTTKPETSPEPTPAEAEALAERVAKRKAELKTRLTSAQKLRLQNKCKAAQGLVSSVRGRIKGLETSRGQVYGNILDRLTGLSEKLKNKGANTDELNADINTLQEKINTFNADLATYKQAVSDLADMDCKTDPDGFKASLEAARAALQKVKDDGLAIRGYLNDTIKPLLKTIRAELEANNAEGSN